VIDSNDKLITKLNEDCKNLETDLKDYLEKHQKEKLHLE
jgi:hypothetical protein